MYFDFEKSFFYNDNCNTKDNHVFIVGMARSGTTILLNAIYRSGMFASYTYQDMPFVLAPNLWSKINKNRPSIDKIERAHGDGIRIDTDSPEAFEEVFWLTFKDKHEYLFDEFDKLIQMLCQKYDKTRYLSKNNQNIRRLGEIIKYFPSSKVIIPFREPLQHSYSLFNQHIKFNKIQKDNSFIKSYMSWIGHSEFGLDYSPFVNKKILYEDHNDINHWLEQWLLSYEYLMKYKKTPNVFFNCYETLCGDVAFWESLLDFIDIEGYEFEFKESKKEVSETYNENLYKKCLELYRSLLK